MEKSLAHHDQHSSDKQQILPRKLQLIAAITVVIQPIFSEIQIDAMKFIPPLYKHFPKLAVFETSRTTKSWVVSETRQSSTVRLRLNCYPLPICGTKDSRVARPCDLLLARASEAAGFSKTLKLRMSTKGQRRETPLKGTRSQVNQPSGHVFF